MTTCPFCQRIATGDVSHRNEHAVAFPDAYPLSEGHTLVIPTRHTADLFAVPAEVRSAVWALVDEVHGDLAERLEPDGFNIGVNVLEAAGQTVAHAHVHVIPRHQGDVADPRGGVRWIIADKAPYWEERPPPAG